MSIAKRKKRHFSLFDQRVIYACMLPGLVLFFCFSVLPSLMTLFLSFTDITGALSTDWHFIGFDNYITFFTRTNPRDLVSTIGRTFVYGISVVVLQNVFALFMALILTQRFIHGRNVYRALFFLPAVLGSTIVAYIWKMLFTVPNGPLYYFLRIVLGIPIPSILTSFQTSFSAIILIRVWMYMGHSCLIYISGLQNISRDLYEAADIDGATEWQSFKHVTFPMIWPSLTVNVLMSIIGSLKTYSLILLITGGDYGTMTLGMQIFNTAFGGSMQQGYAACLEMVMFLIVMLVTFTSNAILRRVDQTT